MKEIAKFYTEDSFIGNKSTKAYEENENNNFNDDDNSLNSSNNKIIYDGVIYKIDKQSEINLYKKVFNDQEYKSVFNDEEEYESMFSILDYLNVLEDLYDNCHNESETKLGKKISREKQNKEKIFEIKKERRLIYRNDYYLKKFKTHFLEYLLKVSNNKLNTCKNQFNLEIKLENIKFRKPNHILYQENTKEKDNKEFIKKNLKDILVDYNKKISEGTSGQRDNEKLINAIYNNNNFPCTKEQKDLKNYLEMKIEKSLDNYYDSDEFQIFKNRRDIKYYDKMFYNERERKFSLLEKGGFNKLVSMSYYCHNPK